MARLYQELRFVRILSEILGNIFSFSKTQKTYDESDPLPHGQQRDFSGSPFVKNVRISEVAGFIIIFDRYYAVSGSLMDSPEWIYCSVKPFFCPFDPHFA